MIFIILLKFKNIIRTDIKIVGVYYYLILYTIIIFKGDVFGNIINLLFK